MLAPPFVTIREHLKSLRSRDMPDHQLKVLRFAAPDIVAGSRRSDHPLAQFVPGFRPTLLGDRELPFQYRRFSGGAELPDGRYYTISRPNGNDSGTLAREIAAYLNPDRKGETYAFDLNDPNQTELRKYCSSFVQGGELRDVIALLFCSRPGHVNPMFEAVEGLKLVEAIRTYPVFYPFSLDEVGIDKVIDLRLPYVREWLTNSLQQGIPGVLYQYGSVVAQGLFLTAIPTSQEDLLSMESQSGSSMRRVYGPRDGWDRAHQQFSDDFFGLLPILMGALRGGNPVTESIGRWLRSLGANGLIYPSARSDVYVEVVDGTFRQSSGWKFVDYRGAPKTDTPLNLIQEPESWAVMSGKILIDPPNSPRSGSFRVEGPEESLYYWLSEQANAF